MTAEAVHDTMETLVDSRLSQIQKGDSMQTLAMLFFATSVALGVTLLFRDPVDAAGERLDRISFLVMAFSYAMGMLLL